MQEHYSSFISNRSSSIDKLIVTLNSQTSSKLVEKRAWHDLNHKLEAKYFKYVDQERHKDQSYLEEEK